MPVSVNHKKIFSNFKLIFFFDKVVLKFRREGTDVELIGMNEASVTIVDKLGIHDKPDALDIMLKH